ncbi:NAD(P)-dependent oxidoreductase [Sulfitobacter mediterraneus]|uniref:NAD-dependent epimerase/dehydratase family protein n=1 Tax=Sulfitobacter mediterraneus TaxID=83219 RepID=UPI00193422DE|nr:NAD(P)-dependent oxidoreductase [Sulfitobacter mediterraneus]MBM1634506.1 NAD(P)-dependent oxidoreductase [Sulfitobacter mediterraneus]MBM1642323.1 NAD(P)-dependent oxidoreductase [Sulfitobacter mediterraneus]MBM1646372.1 NAD(P)-dependent oxidoreductase [Sulfitobacter mediterraneus]MBM1650418.1 NAD(P)-dependent oxidoreductase [Sulfitobacter mediterraneus]MBM1654440.1 NAD(P)-dependent oxidoreductase [Sulfitobacter mediterraneus]
MKVFVTGGTGVLGRPVIRALARCGHTIIAMARNPAKMEALRALGAEPIGASLFDPSSLRDGMAGCDAVLHLATRIPKTSDMKSATAWADNDRIRDEGTRNLVDVALASDSVKTFIYPSVFFMYADGRDTWLSAKSAKLDPPTPLRSTLTAENHVARFAAHGSQNRGINLRFGSFYGPSSRDSQEMIAMARKGVVMPLASGGTYKSMIWIDDAASAVIAALNHGQSGTFDVAETEPFTQDQAIKALATAVGRRGLFKLPRFLLRFALHSDMRGLLGRSQRITSQEFSEMTGWQAEVANQTEGWQRIA